MRKILTWLINFLVERSKHPYVAYITSGISDDGQIKFEMYWNKGLIENLHKNGIRGANDNETAMLFLVGFFNNVNIKFYFIIAIIIS